MAENTGIEWTDHTFNPWIGCTKVHAGCANCYAEADMDKRRGRVRWGPQGTRSMTKTWGAPRKWNKTGKLLVECDNPDCRYRRVVPEGMEDTFCSECGWPSGSAARPRVFCASLADVFEDWDGPIIDHNGERLYWPHNAMQTPTKYIAESHCGSGEPPVTMDDLRRDLFALIDATPNLDWLLLTKRPENIRRMMSNVDWNACDSGDCPHEYERECDTEDQRKFRDNMWLGTSVSDQSSADKQIPELLKCRDLSPVLFLSVEPLLDHIQLEVLRTGDFDSLDCLTGTRSYAGRGGRAGHETTGHAAIDWVIVGGESGPQARPMHPQWVRDLRDQCEGAGVPFFFKQWGEWKPICEMTGFECSALYRSNVKAKPGESQESIDDIHGRTCRVDTSGFQYDGQRGWKGGDPFVIPYQVFKVGKKAAGRLLDGREWSEFPGGQKLTTGGTESAEVCDG